MVGKLLVALRLLAWWGISTQKTQTAPSENWIRNYKPILGDTSHITPLSSDTSIIEDFPTVTPSFM